MEGDVIFYQFSRSKVEQCDFSHFLGLYAPDELPEGRPLRDMMNCFVFCIEGYDSDPREIHLIPEVRRFYSAFHEAWPYWLYFCNLDVDTGPLPRMLKGITAAEDAYLQREANALARRMFRRRVKDPAKTLADLRARLRRAGWVQIKIRWSGSDTLVVDAGIGARLKAKLRESKFFSADERLFSGFLGAARKVGLKPGIEDLSVDLKGQRIEASVSAVPMADMSAVLDRMLDRWRDQDRARAARARKATT
jgi:hypothetical protein